MQCLFHNALKLLQCNVIQIYVDSTNGCCCLFKSNNHCVAFFFSQQNNISTTGFLSSHVRGQATAASVLTTRWTLWWGRQASASASVRSSSTCCCPASSLFGSTRSKCRTASARMDPSASCTNHSPSPALMQTPASTPPLEPAAPSHPSWIVT